MSEPRIGQSVVYKGPQEPDQVAIVTHVNKDDNGNTTSVNLVAWDGGSWQTVSNVEHHKGRYQAYRTVDEDFHLGAEDELQVEPSPVEQPVNGATDQTQQPNTQ